MTFPNEQYVVFDVETTGLFPHRGDRIIEIGAVSVSEGLIDGEFHSLVYTVKRIPAEAQRIHGITAEMLQNAPPAEEVFPRFHEFIKDRILVAHNAEFDMSFIRREFQRQGLILNQQCVCTMEMSRRHFPQLPNHKLYTVYRHLMGCDAPYAQRHRALADARMAAEIWLAIRKMNNEV
jgi:DNA polymerase-3 subunit epsilon